MSYFAKVENGMVVQVISAEQDVIDSGLFGDPKDWIQTSYNTLGGVHYKPNSTDPSEDQSKALRKNYASIGYIYDSVRDAFYQPQPFPSWTLNEFSCFWEAPVPYPDPTKKYNWDEDTLSWVEL